jgi:hypothetical protein
LRIKNGKNWHLHDQLHVLAAILTRWQHPVAPNRRSAIAIKMASKVGLFFVVFLFAVALHGGRWGNMEQVVARWRHPVASMVALNMLHQVMPSVLLRHTPIAIKTASG